ncbi:uncharacterized protein LOC126091884 [Schistocerca cancellata]|uniref:uncharacterized protein LOC126091884 n=1 Tax=Schistocerca cancellata TaxID=274614 RepID=UPI002119632D|nr:uncharacterized protein LOC126091884 [Schistocerca cancellata]XP_049763128.1 uncharacterized protein LOC126091884 [Schistocerca cancellata]
MGDHSPAELLHGRTLLHLLRLSTLQPRVPSLGRFTANDLVWVREYGRRPKWSPGCILRHRGRHLYEIQTDMGVAVRHSDQLRPRMPAMPVPNAATPPLALPDTQDLGISQYSQHNPLTIIAMPAQERTPPGDVPMQEPDDHPLSEQIYSPPPPTDADTSPMSPVISTGLAATGRLVHGAPADSTPTSPVISTRYHRGHFRPYRKPPPPGHLHQDQCNNFKGGKSVVTRRSFKAPLHNYAHPLRAVLSASHAAAAPPKRPAEQRPLDWDSVLIRMLTCTHVLLVNLLCDLYVLCRSEIYVLNLTL